MLRIEEDNLNIRQIAESGQVFRFRMIREDTYVVRTGDRALKITKADKNAWFFHCDRQEYDEFWKGYFDIETDYSDFISSIPGDDVFLTKAAVYSEGIRILKQDPWEMLISFIISQRKSIPAIRTSIEKLCESFGTFIDSEDADLRGYAFPSPEQLALAELDDITACSVGYRAPYIYEAAKKTASGEYGLGKWSLLDDDALMQKLLGIHGVGTKVANCVMLFGYYRIGAFPVDVWIRRVIDEHYNGNFPVENYPGYAGIIQQYIFFYMREKTIAKKLNKT